MKKLWIISVLLGSSLLSADQSIVSTGDVLVNGKVLTENTTIKAGDIVETKAKSKVRFNIGKDAFMAQGKSKFSFKKSKGQRILNVINGGVLSVFEHGNHGIETPNMTAGVRGTATFTMVKEGKTYYCTCYGHTELEAKDYDAQKTLKATHHNMVWITPNKIQPAKNMEGHTDNELRLLENMVGRVAEFDKLDGALNSNLLNRYN
jgi:hypothetical protein